MTLFSQMSDICLLLHKISLMNQQLLEILPDVWPWPNIMTKCYNSMILGTRPSLTNWFIWHITYVYPKVYYHKERFETHNKVTCLKTGFLVWRKNEFKVPNTFWDVMVPLSRRHKSSEQLLWQPRITYTFKW